MTLTITKNPTPALGYRGMLEAIHGDCPNTRCLTLFILSCKYGETPFDNDWPICLMCKHCWVEPARWQLPLQPNGNLWCKECLRTKSTSHRNYGGFFSDAHARQYHLTQELMADRLGDDMRPFPGDLPPKRPYTGPKGASKFDKIKAAVRIEEFAGRFTELRPAGPGKMKGCCPLHQESTPSFHVWLDKQTWRCFGACAMGGDVITLTQQLMDKGLFTSRG
jgi:hypothetical protein